MYLETQAARQYQSITTARYLAEAGVAHARVLLDQDAETSLTDDEAEDWARQLQGAEADADGDGQADARWWALADEAGEPTGRYAARIEDEGGKAHLNAAQADGGQAEPGAVDLTAILAAAGLPDAPTLAATIEGYRYGEDGQPGAASVDDDGDGVIDNEAEYHALALRGDDRRYESLEELVRVAHVSAEQVKALGRVATVYSWDVNTSVTGQPRLNVNTATVNELLTVLLQAGVDDPWQLAVHLADAADPDYELSTVIKAAQTLAVASTGTVEQAGAWTLVAEPSAHYESDGNQGPALRWVVEPPSGVYYVRVLGLAGRAVGPLTIGEVFTPAARHGEALGTFTFDGPVTIEAGPCALEEAPCAFTGLELVTEGAATGVPVRGVEAVRINEIMVNPAVSFAAADADFHPSTWICAQDRSKCWATGVGEDTVTWTLPSENALPAGPYYVRVFGEAGFDAVCLRGECAALANGQRHPESLAIAGGEVELTLRRSTPEKTYYLERVELSLLPDAQYVELMNLSAESIDVRGWVLASPLLAARLPEDRAVTIAPHGLLVAAVDLDDAQPGVSGNGISARAAWGLSNAVPAISLTFPGGGFSPDTQWLASTAAGTLTLMTRDGGTVVDQIEYEPPAQVGTVFRSLEKGDPTVVQDEDHDGYDEAWYLSSVTLAPGYTPGTGNNNEGLKEVQGLFEPPILHDPTQEITLRNHALGGVGELVGIPSGQAWRPLLSEDVANLVDRFTVSGWRLEAEAAWAGELQAATAWAPRQEGYYEHVEAQRNDVSGRWRWTQVPDGRYRFSLYSCSGCRDEQLALRWQRADETWTAWAYPPASDAQGRIFVGELVIGALAADEVEAFPDATASGQLALELRCTSPSGICRVDRVQLDPRLIQIGLVNVNTAPREVLAALPGATEALVERLIAGRPYGDQEGRARGIGDLLVAEVPATGELVLGAEEEDRLAVFRRWADVLTTRSHVFQILSLGQATGTDSAAAASQRIQAVIER
jgi:type II secretory pathway component PulK